MSAVLTSVQNLTGGRYRFELRQAGAVHAAVLVLTGEIDDSLVPCHWEEQVELLFLGDLAGLRALQRAGVRVLRGESLDLPLVLA